MTRKTFNIVYVAITVIAVVLWGLHIIPTNIVTYFVLGLSLFSVTTNLYLAYKQNNSSKKD